MEPVTKLIDIIGSLASYDDELTIVAVEPWTENSNALVAYEPEEGGLPPEPANAGIKYFLEIFTANEVVEGFLMYENKNPSASDSCQRIIYYAINYA